MRKKPYLECPYCGCQVATLKERMSDNIRSRNVYDCKKCNKKLGVPYWCLWLELFMVVVITFTLLIILKNSFLPWLQVRISLNNPTSTILTLVLLLGISVIIAFIFSYLVPLKEIEPFDYGDYSMVSRHKGNDSDEQE